MIDFWGTPSSERTMARSHPPPPADEKDSWSLNAAATSFVAVRT